MQEGSLDKKTASQLNTLYMASGGEIGQAYSELAEGYDSFAQSISYLSPKKCLELIIKACPCEPEHARVLDLGCGTGEMGKLLKESGFEKMVGLDPSEGMLKKAEEKKIYDQLHQGFLGNGSYPEELKDSFEVVVLAGVLNVNHAPPEALDEAVSSMKGNGIIVFSLPDAVGEEKGYLAKLKELQSLIKFKDSVSF